MIAWLRKRKAPNLNECIEEVFFRAMLIVGLIGCTIVVLFDLLITNELTYIVPVNIMAIQVFLLSLYAITNLDFHRGAIFSLAMLDLVMTFRGFMYPEFRHVTCTVLITIGFMCALVGEGKVGLVLKWGILVSLVIILFQEYKSVTLISLVRQAIPYLIVYFIITISSGLLKERYARNQNRLTELITLLNQKNAKINEQHHQLQISYQELDDLNKNLGIIITQKTNRIMEKNKQLADLAFENAHCVRAPLARMLGLVHLIKMDPERKDFYISKLDEQLLEMDVRICMISKSLERNLHE